MDLYCVECIFITMQQVPDYRSGRKKPHVVAEMLTYLICGFLCGRTSISRALTWARSHLSFLRKFMPLEHGIASEATISRMLSHLDEKMFELIFIGWINMIVKIRGTHLCIDGKALRGGTQRIRGGNTPYVLNIIEESTRLVLAQMLVDTKTNEATVIPEALELLSLTGRVITIDSAGTHRNIMELILQKGGHFVLPVKKNNRTMYDEILEMFSNIGKVTDGEGDNKLQEYLQPYLESYSATPIVFEKNRERHEYRKMEVCTDTSFLSCVAEEEEYAEEEDNHLIGSAALSTQVRILKEEDENGNDITPELDDFLKNGSRKKPHITEGDSMNDDVAKVGLISDMVLTPEEFAEYKRSHWEIENGLHHVLDVDFAEDRSPAKGSKNNLALLRKFAYNVLRLAIIKSDPKCGVQEMMDRFADHNEMLGTYVFSGIECIAA